MNNNKWLITRSLPAGAAATCLLLLLAAPVADAACSYHKRKLVVGTHSIALLQKDSRCVLAGQSSESGTFEIAVRGANGYEPDLDAIRVRAKDADGPVKFQVADVKEQSKTLVVLVTWDGTADANAEYAYAIDVPGVGFLDPRVQIIRTSPMMAYSTALQQLAEEHLDSAAYEFIVRELLPKTQPAAQ